MYTLGFYVAGAMVLTLIFRGLNSFASTRVIGSASRYGELTGSRLALRDCDCKICPLSFSIRRGAGEPWSHSDPGKDREWTEDPKMVSWFHARV